MAGISVFAQLSLATSSNAATSIAVAVSYTQAQRAIRVHAADYPFLSIDSGYYTINKVYIPQISRTEYAVTFTPLFGPDPVFATIPALGDTAQNSLFAYDLSANASDFYVVGASETGTLGAYHAFRWQASDGVTTDLGTLASPADDADTFSAAFGISNDGSTIVGGSKLGPTDVEHAFRIGSDNTMTDLGSLAGAASNSFATAVNSDGSVVVGGTDVTGGGSHAFRWDQTPSTNTGVMTDLGGFGGNSVATAVNLDGSVVVGGADMDVVIASTHTNRTHATMWTAPTNTPTDLGVLPGDTASIANDVSGDGTIVVGVSDSTGVSGPTGDILGVSYDAATSHAFRWTQATGIKDLRQLLIDAGVDMTNIRLSSANGISKDGQVIVGAGIFPGTPSGSTSAYLVRYCDGPCPDDSIGITTPSSVGASLASVATQQSSVANNVGGTADGLLGFNQPVGGGSELGGFGAAGSFTLGSSGRWNLNGNTTLVGGIAFTSQSYSGVDVTSAGLAAAGLRYTTPRGHDLAAFIEGGGWVAPAMDLTLSRTYANGAGTATGTGSTNGFMGGVYARAGVVWTPKPTREIALSAAVGHSWLNVAGYAEAGSASNPFPATFSDRSAGASFVKVQTQWTEALTPKWDMTLSGAIGRTFGSSGPLTASVTGLGAASVTPAEYTFEEYGARLGYKLNARDTIDVFAFGSSAEGLGSHFEIGTGFRALL